MTNDKFIAVIDCGSQTTKLIARRVRELGVFSRVFSARVNAEELTKENPQAIILSGGPESLLDENPLRIDKNIFDLGIPILGICYGMQLIVEHFEGILEKCGHREFGQRMIDIKENSLLFDGLNGSSQVWMSHSDQAKIVPPDFRTIAKSSTCEHVAIEHKTGKILALQFHPEVSHTSDGLQILSNFLFKIAKAQKSFDLNDFLSRQIEVIRHRVGQEKVIMGLSGGVDSMVAALLIHKAIGDQLHCVYVNHGLHRHNEVAETEALFSQVFAKKLMVINAEEQFFAGLHGVTDPEQKRKIIGRIFIEVFDSQAISSKAKFFRARHALSRCD
jgi:GMP synthase (glutamine-hydrolysing)